MPASVASLGTVASVTDPAFAAGPALWPLLLLWLVSVYGVASALSFTAYALDKAAAMRGARRLRERTLLLLDLCCGWPGGLLAQRWLRHKTVKPSYRRWYCCMVLINCAAVAALLARF